MLEAGKKDVKDFSLRTIFLFSLTIIVLDQLSKYLCKTNMSLGELIPVFPGLDFYLAHNYGAAFSFLNDAGGWQRWVLTSISLIFSGVFIVWLIRLPKNESLQAIALAMILGGALGNFIDRFFVGYVIDFLSVYYQNYRFATFNIADAAISVGAVLMIIDTFLGPKKISEKKSTLP